MDMRLFLKFPMVLSMVEELVRERLCCFLKDSGKKKAHKHRSFWLVRGQSPGRVARGGRLMCYLRNPRNINLFALAPDWEDR